MAWEQGNRVRIHVEDPKDVHFARNGMVVWVVRLIHEHKSLGFVHPKAEADGTARHYEVVGPGDAAFRIWGVHLQGIDGTPSAES